MLHKVHWAQHRERFASLSLPLHPSTRDDVTIIWMILKTLVHFTLHPKRYETRHKHTVRDCNVLLFCEVHCFEKHPYVPGEVSRELERFRGPREFVQGARVMAKDGRARYHFQATSDTHVT